MENKLLIRVYFISTAMVAAFMLGCCFLLNWQLAMMPFVLAACLVFPLPLLVALHLLFILARKIKATTVFFWMLLLASIPILFLLPADFLSGLLPGKTPLLAGLGVISAYASVLTNGNGLAHLFNSFQNENE